MRRQARAPRMVAPGGVDQEHVGPHGERAHGPLQQRPFTQREQARLVRSSQPAGYHGRVKYEPA
ncbi:MAG: hypothetical protein J2P44_12095, partial [Candidatus Dormibacteraeota bacterium]|nr:hypothetical protein [Candidatus Dormibacteraeota bacterium]